MRDNNIESTKRGRNYMLANSLHTTLNLSLSVLLRSRNPLVKFELFHQKFSRGALIRHLTHFCYLHSVLNDHFKFPYWVTLSTICKKGFPLRKRPSLENYIPVFHLCFQNLTKTGVTSTEARNPS